MTIAEFWKERYEVVVAEKKAVGEKLRETLEENKDLQARINNLTSSNESLRGINSRIFKSLSSSKHQTQELKTQLEAKAEEYKKELKKKSELLNTIADLDAQLKHTTERFANTTLSLRIVNERLDKSIADRSELQADRDIWFRKNGEKQAEIEELKKKIQSLEADLEFKALCRG